VKRIEQMYAFVMPDEDAGMEGVPAFAGHGFMLPLVAADTKRLEQLRPIAQRMARETGKAITLCRFEVRTELEVFEP
jgi:hypothetical protein